MYLLKGDEIFVCSSDIVITKWDDAHATNVDGRTSGCGSVGIWVNCRGRLMDTTGRMMDTIGRMMDTTTSITGRMH